MNLLKLFVPAAETLAYGTERAGTRRVQTDTPYTYRPPAPKVVATKSPGTSSPTPTGIPDMTTYGFNPLPGGSFYPTTTTSSGFSWGGLLDYAGKAVVDRYISGSGSEPAQGNAPVPGNLTPGANSGSGCEFPSFMLGGKCVNPAAAMPGGAPLISSPSQYGEATYGRYGLALVPAQETITRAKCPPGMVLGKDGLCYESLPKRDRKWNPGAKPLLTGGEMNAINRANRAAKRLQSTQKKLKKVGKAIGKVC